MDKNGKKEVLIFIFDGYADWECAYIGSVLNAADSEYVVKTISLDKLPKTSMAGFHVTPDYSIDDAPGQFYLLILTGGNAWMEQANNGVLPLVKHAVKSRIPVGAICNAANFMAENGFLDQIKHTGNSLEFMKSQAPHYRGEPHFLERQAVCDSNIITANGTAALEFAREILRLLMALPEAVISEWYTGHKDGFYSV